MACVYHPLRAVANTPHNAFLLPEYSQPTEEATIYTEVQHNVLLSSDFSATRHTGHNSLQLQTHVSLAPALSGSPVTSPATPCQHPLLGPLRHVGLYSLECSRTQSSPLLSSVSSDSTPLKYQRMLTAYRLTSQVRSSPLESGCTPPATCSASPIRDGWLKLLSKTLLPSSYSTAILSF